MNQPKAGLYHECAGWNAEQSVNQTAFFRQDKALTITLSLKDLAEKTYRVDVGLEHN